MRLPALSDWIAALRRGALLLRLLTIAAGFLGFALCILAADQFWPGGVPGPLMATAGLGGAAVTPIAFALAVRRVFALRWNPQFAARDLERARAVPHNLVLNAVQLAAAPQAAYAASAAIEQAGRAIQSAPPGTPESFRSVRRAAMGLLLIGCGWVLLAVLSPKPLWVSVARLFGAGLPPPTATHIRLVRPGPGDIAYAAEALRLDFEVRGPHAGGVHFELLDSDRPDAVVLLARACTLASHDGLPGTWSIHLAPHEVSADLHFRCRAGDATVRGVVQVFPQPREQELHLTVTPPPCAGNPFQTPAPPELNVVEGTTATVRFRANTPIREPIFVMAGARPARTRMTLDPSDPASAALQLPPLETAEYWIEFQDRWGRAAGGRRTRRFVVRPDLPPQVWLIAPSDKDVGEGGVLDVAEVSLLRARAADDLALSSVHLVAALGGELYRIPLWDLQRSASRGLPGRQTDSQRPREVDVSIAMHDVPLAPGESVQLWFEAADNRTAPDGSDAAQTGRSRVLTLRRAAIADSAPVPERETPLVAASAGGGEPDGEPADGAASAGNESAGTGADGRGDNAPARSDEADSVAESLEGQREFNDAGGTDDGHSAASGRSEGATSGSSRGDPATNAAASGGSNEPSDQDAADANEPPAGEPGARAAAENASADEPLGSGAMEAGDVFEERLRRFEEQFGEAAEIVRARLDDAGGQPEAVSGNEAGDGGAPPERSGRDQLGDQPASDRVPSAPQPSSEPSVPGQSDWPHAQPGFTQPDGDADGDAERPASPGERPPAQSAPAQSEEAPPQPADEADTSHASGEMSTGDPPSRRDAASPASDRSMTSASGATADRPGGDGPRGERPDGPDETTSAAPLRQSDSAGSHGPEVSIPQQAGDAAADQAAVGGHASRGNEPPEVVPVSPRAATLELIARAEEVGPEHLSGLDWPPQQRDAFLRELKALHAAAVRAGRGDRSRTWISRAEIGRSEVTPGAAGGLPGDTIAPADPYDSPIEAIAPPPEQRVPPELRALLDAYYQSMAAPPSRPPDSRPAGPD